MTMRLNVAAMRGQHDRFLTAHSDMAAAVAYDASVVALAEIAVHPGFKPRTGALQAAAKTRIVRTRSGKVIRISDDRPYARWIEEGTRPHKIFARKAKFLRFFDRNGVLQFRRSVNHPGNRPYWFMRNATRVAGSTVERRMLSGMQRAASRFGN